MTGRKKTDSTPQSAEEMGTPLLDLASFVPKELRALDDLQISMFLSAPLHSGLVLCRWQACNLSEVFLPLLEVRLFQGRLSRAESGFESNNTHINLQKRGQFSVH